MIPKNLKVGDIFEEKYPKHTLKYQVIGIDDEGRYISKLVEDDDKEYEQMSFVPEPEPAPVETEKPVEEKKPATKKTTPKKA